MGPGVPDLGKVPARGLQAELWEVKRISATVVQGFIRQYKRRSD